MIGASSAARAQNQEAGSASERQQADAAQNHGSDVEKARQLFAEGLTFVEAEDWVQAEDRFRRVLALKASNVVAYNLASALVHLQRLVQGSELLRATLRDPTLDASTGAAARQLLSEVEPRIASLTIRLSGDTAGVTVRVDDQSLAVTGQVLTTSLDPGEHTIVAERGLVRLGERTVTVGGTDMLIADVAFDLPPRLQPRDVVVARQSTPQRTAELPGSASRASSSTDQASSWPWWLWAGAGVAVAAGVVVAIVVASSGDVARPVAGDTDPPVVRGIVVAVP